MQFKVHILAVMAARQPADSFVVDFPRLVDLVVETTMKCMVVLAMLIKPWIIIII